MRYKFLFIFLASITSSAVFSSTTCVDAFSNQSISKELLNFLTDYMGSTEISNMTGINKIPVDYKDFKEKNYTPY